MMGAYLLDGLRGLMRHKIVGDVRGKGLLLGVRTGQGPGDQRAGGRRDDHRDRRFLPR